MCKTQEVLKTSQLAQPALREVVSQRAWQRGHGKKSMAVALALAGSPQVKLTMVKVQLKGFDRAEYRHLHTFALGLDEKMGAFHQYPKELSNLSGQESQGHSSLSRAAAHGSWELIFHLKDPPGSLLSTPGTSTIHATPNKCSHVEPLSQSSLGDKEGYLRSAP